MKLHLVRGLEKEGRGTLLEPRTNGLSNNKSALQVDLIAGLVCRPARQITYTHCLPCHNVSNCGRMFLYQAAGEPASWTSMHCQLGKLSMGISTVSTLQGWTAEANVYIHICMYIRGE